MGIPHGVCGELRAGMERHVTPAGNARGVVTRSSADRLFGADALGFGNTLWTRLVSWLARNGIAAQTGTLANAKLHDGALRKTTNRRAAHPVASASGSVPQTALTLIHTVVPEHADVLRSYLDRLGDDVAVQTEIPLLQLPTLHFARWVVLDGARAGEPPLLAFESNHDGDSRTLIEQLVTVGGEGVRRIYEKCAHYDPHQDLADFMLAGEIPTAAFYVAHRGRTCARIKREASVREAIDRFLDDRRPELFVLPPTEIRSRVQKHVTDLGLDLPPPLPVSARWPDPIDWVKENVGTAIAVGVLTLPVTISVAAVGLLGWGRLRHLEHGDLEDEVDRRPEHDRVVARREDVQVQNQLTHVATLKRGLFRRILLRGVLFAIDLLARKRYTVGDLGGIPSIHFARWAFIDNGRRLLFLSNYDGTWESYLGDFIDKAHDGLTAVWSNTDGFPRSRNLVGEGAVDEERFKSWTRNRQVHSHLWYSAYPHLSNADIMNNALVCEGLARDLSDAEAREWLKLLTGGRVGSTTVSDLASHSDVADRPLEANDIQGIVLSGYGKHPWSAALVVHFDSKDEAAIWLRSFAEHVSSGEGVDERDVHFNVAFTQAGLDALGLDKESLTSFSREFQEGMTEPPRPHALGDINGSAPEQWSWGGPTAGAAAVHALVLVYTKFEARLQEQVSAIESALAAAHVRVVYRKTAEMLLARREHFGFVDGISQPPIRGYHASAPDAVAGGEFVFGYPNAYGKIPVAPRFAHANGNGICDLALNGTYLVVRQLDQHVAAFTSFCKIEGDRLYPLEPGGDRVAAQCVGRWRNGTPLVIEARVKRESDPIDESNTFGYSGTPPGTGCPVTAHIRRANPRDGLDASAEASRLVVNRHRILRRGRSYGAFLEPDEDDERDKRGLFFMCVNTNIARQFEFIQQTWVENPKFAGLAAGHDPLIGRPDGTPLSTVALPGSPFRGRIANMSAFVDVIGGAYFFLPGLRALRAIAQLRAR